jgi:hypothetical protein
LARLAGHGVQVSTALFLDSDGKHLHNEALRAWLYLRKSLKVRKDSGGKLAHDHPAARALVSSILDGYGWNRPKGTAKLCNLFSDTKELRLALAARIVRAFDLPSTDALEDKHE